MYARKQPLLLCVLCGLNNRRNIKKHKNVRESLHIHYDQQTLDSSPRELDWYISKAYFTAYSMLFGLYELRTGAILE
jgi:hypothetical protein